MPPPGIEQELRCPAAGVEDVGQDPERYDGTERDSESKLRRREELKQVDRDQRYETGAPDHQIVGEAPVLPPADHGARGTRQGWNGIEEANERGHWEVGVCGETT